MRNHLAWALLPILVVTLAVSNMLLAKKVVALREEIPMLVAHIASSSHHESPTPSATPMHTSMPVPTNYPMIASLVPTSGKFNTTVTIKGKDFLAKNNEIIIGKTFVIATSSRDGETLRFTIPARLADCAGQGDTEVCTILNISAFSGQALPVWVRNANGVSNRVLFTIKK